MLMPIDDHLAHRGDGVFESLKAERGRVYLLPEHLARLEKSAGAMGLALPCPRAELQKLTLAVAAAGGEPHCMLRILLGRGPGGFGIDPAESPRPSLYIVAYRFQPREKNWFMRGQRAFRSRYPAKPAAVAQVKNTAYQTAVAMLREEQARGSGPALLFDNENCLAEGAISNVCLICPDPASPQGAKLVAPDFSHALPGTTLLRIIELLRPVIPTEIRKVREEEIFTALEMLQTGTTVDCASITHYEDRPIGSGEPGPWAARIRELLARDLDENGLKF